MVYALPLPCLISGDWNLCLICLDSTKSKTYNSTWCAQGLDSNLPKAEWRLLGSPSEDQIGAQAPSLCLQLPGPYVLHWLEAAGGRVWDR